MTLRDVIPATYRKVIYGVYAVIGFLLGAIQVGYASSEGTAQPEWLFVALAVFGYTGVALGLVAGANTVPAEPVDVNVVDYQGQHERGAVDSRTIAIVAFVLAFVALFFILL